MTTSLQLSITGISACSFFMLWYVLSLRQYFEKKHVLYITLVPTWFFLTAALAWNEFFPGYVTAAALVAMILASLAPPLHKELSRAPQPLLIGLQGIRVFVELCLLGLATNKLLPWEMTIQGRNLDLLVGLSALPLAAFVMARGPAKMKKLIISWNCFGMAMLTVFVAHGVFFRPEALTKFPLQWLPSFLVPCAYFLHLVSLRKAIVGAADGAPQVTFNADGTPQLQAPGKGLPLFEGLLVRWVTGPLLPRMMSWEKTAAVFQKENVRILAMAESLRPEQLTERVLVPPQQGLEDSSRHWSAIMVLEHLLITHGAMKQFVVALSHGKAIDVVADVAKVKPTGEPAPEHVLADFKKMTAEIMTDIDGAVGDRKAKALHLHPWLGPLNAHGWRCLMAVHSSVHRRQMRNIVKTFSARK